jgi:multidrug/hemolysin transport system permease protein
MSSEETAMDDFVALVRRHMIKFLRDKAAVFFSFLSILIMLALYFLFIGRQYVSYESMDGMDEGFKTFLTTGIMMGGILVINTVSLSLGIMGNVVLDIEQKRLDAFLVTPVRRSKVILSYYAAAIIVTATLTLVMWALTYLYVGIRSGYWYDVLTVVQVSGLLVGYTFVSSAFMIFMVTLIRTVNAFGTLSGVLGTFVGFVSGIYMPLFVLGETMTKVASLVPFTHMTIILRRLLLAEPYSILEPDVPAWVMEDIRIHYGTNAVGVLGADVGMGWIMGATAILVVLALYVSFQRMQKRMRR